MNEHAVIFFFTTHALLIGRDASRARDQSWPKEHMVSEQVPDPGAQGGHFETSNRPSPQLKAPNSPRTLHSPLDPPFDSVDHPFLKKLPTKTRSPSAKPTSTGFSPKEKQQLLDEGFTFIAPRNLSNQNSPKKLKTPKKTKKILTSSTIPTKETNIPKPKPSSINFNDPDFISMANSLKNQTARSANISEKRKRPNVPNQIKEHFQELNTFEVNSKFGSTYKALFNPDSTFRSQADFGSFQSAVLEKMKADPKISFFGKFIQCYASKIKILSFYHQQGQKSIKTASLTTTFPAIFKQQDDLKERFDAIIKSTAHDFDFTLLSNENHDHQHLSVLHLTFSEHVNSMDFENITSKFLQPYGNVIYQYTKPPEATVIPNLGLHHFVILQACNNCLPPLTKKFFSEELQEVITINTHVISCTNRNYCHYCKSITHKTNKCPFKKGCFHCHSDDHTYLQCPIATSFDKICTFQNNPEPIRNTFFEFPRFKSGIPPLLIEYGIAYLNKRAKEEKEITTHALLSPRKHPNPSISPDSTRKMAKLSIRISEPVSSQIHPKERLTSPDITSTRSPPGHPSNLPSMHDTTETLKVLSNNHAELSPSPASYSHPTEITLPSVTLAEGETSEAISEILIPNPISNNCQTYIPTQKDSPVIEEEHSSGFDETNFSETNEANSIVIDKEKTLSTYEEVSTVIDSATPSISHQEHQETPSPEI